MKKITLFGLLLLLSFTQKELSAQAVPASTKDSITIAELIQLAESKGSRRIYTNLPQTLKLATPQNESSATQLLENALKGTQYSVSTYGNKIYILSGEALDTRYVLSLENQKMREQLTSLEKSVKSAPEASTYTNSEIASKSTNSENRIYTIGDKYSKEQKSKITLKGKVTNFTTGEPMPGVNIILKDPYVGCATDNNGNYTIQLPSGRLKIDISGLIVKPSSRQLIAYSDGRLDIQVMEDTKILEGITITADRLNTLRNTQIGVERIKTDNIKNIPMALGEVDLIKALQTLPGVKTAGEASSGFNVRGGAADQNLILLNNGTIYNSNHLFGFFTAFSTDMISDAELFKSSIPSKYGGRISSVLNINGKEASMEKFSGSVGIGLVTSNAAIEIPLAKQKSSLLLTGRTTYSDWILRSLPKDSGYNDGSANFYDIGLVFTQKINKNNTLNIYGYYSHDQFSFSKNDKYAYENLNASFKWKSVLSKNLILNLSGGYDQYDYNSKDIYDPSQASKFAFDINQIFAKADFTLKKGKHKIGFGLNTILYNVNGGSLSPVGDQTLIKHDALEKERALESALYISDEWSITPDFTVSAGLRYSIFNAMGPRTYNTYLPGMLPHEQTITGTVNKSGIFKTYQAPEFRLAATYVMQNNLSIKAGVNTMTQYIHKLSNSATMSATETWKLSDANIKPQRGWQAATGLYYALPQKNIEASVEVYYKRMKDYLDYRSGAQLIMNHHIETDVVPSQGYAYGAEFLLQKHSGKLSGWLSYTYSRTFLRQNDKIINNPVNRGDWYPTNYDKPHDFKLVGNYKFTDRYSFSLNIDYSTGRPITIPAGKYYNPDTGTTQVYYSDRNSYRIPDYFRGDIAFNFEPSHKKTSLIHSKVSVGIYNFTGRKNVYSIYYVSEGDQIKGYQLSIFGSMIPYITYNIKF